MAENMFTMSLFCGFVCAIAAFAGGFIDAISGGGGLLTIPALLLTGVPPHLALGTNKVSACCGTTVALFNFAKHGLVNWRMAGYGIIFSIIGSWLGAWLALILESALLGKVLVALLPLAMIATLLPQKQHDDILPPRDGFRFWVLLPIVCVAIGLYDGFFGPGTGIFLILALHWVLKMGLIQASATAKAFNLASNVSAAVSFIWHDSVYWPLAIIMGVCFVAGNWIGSAVAIKIGSRLVRRLLLVSLVLLLGTLLWQFFIAPAN